MTHQTLKLAIQYLVEIKVISSDRFNAIYLWMQKRLFKKSGFGSVTYELSDTQKITVTRDSDTCFYSIEIITPKPLPTVTQPTELKPTVANAVPLQLSIFDHLEVDADKALQYFRTHKKVRRPRLVVNNAYKPQLEIRLTFKLQDIPAGNVTSLCEARQKRQPKVQHYNWGWQYLFDKTGF